MKRSIFFRNFIIITAIVTGLGFLEANNVKGAFGDPDPAFGSNGFKTDYDLDYSPAAFARQGDGKIVVVGQRDSDDLGYDELVVRRYLANGSIDTGFGSNGSAIPYQAGGRGYDVIIQRDGKIAVVGRAVPGYGTAVWRFKADGWYDPTFGSFGRVLTWGDGHCRNIASYREGGTGPFELIVACYNGELFRLKSDGTPNSSFGSGGLVDTEGAWRMALRSGSIYIVYAHEIKKYTMTGQLDLSFGTQGVFSQMSDYSCVSGSAGGTSYQQIGFQIDGTMIIGGFRQFFNNGLEEDLPHLTAHQSNGNFVPGFISLPCDDVTDLDLEDYAMIVNVAMSVQADNRILIANQKTVERRFADGSYENSYQITAHIKDLLILPDGKILTLSYFEQQGHGSNYFKRARLSQNLP